MSVVKAAFAVFVTTAVAGCGYVVGGLLAYKVARKVQALRAQTVEEAVECAMRSLRAVVGNKAEEN
jgi:hypothetical protein